MTRCCSVKSGVEATKPVQLDDAADAGEIAERGLRLGEDVDGAEFGGALAGRRHRRHGRDDR